jgi:hypothetical protein
VLRTEAERALQLHGVLAQAARNERGQRARARMEPVAEAPGSPKRHVPPGTLQGVPTRPHPAS